MLHWARNHIAVAAGNGTYAEKGSDVSHVTSHPMDPRQVTLPSTWRSSTPSMILGKRPTIRGVLSSMISYSLRAGDPWQSGYFSAEFRSVF